uniref:Abhydrolase_3 domain-containing protein n=1 Tax=Rhabditophanes sp. KR3021 TaxID=114890 RepID=A0AC35UIC3_9BILA
MKFPKWIDIEEVVIDGVKCRIYIPQPDKRNVNNKMCLFYIHSGGWCIMKAKYSDYYLAPFIRRLGCTIVSIDYSLAPENKFPAAINECEKVVLAFYNGLHQKYDIDKNKLVIMGESAGGNLSIASCLRLTNNNNSNIIKCQVLVYPVVNSFDLLNRSYQIYNKKHKNTGLLSPDDMARWILLYLGLPATVQNVKLMLRNQHISNKIRNNEEFKTYFNCDALDDEEDEFETAEIESYEENDLARMIEPYLLNCEFAPVMAPLQKLSLLPPTLTITSNFDVLKTEGRLFHDKIKKAGIDATYKNYKNAIHGHLTVPFSRVARSMRDDICNFINCQLNNQNSQ